MELSSIQKERYSRHIVIDEIGESGQKQLLNAKVLIIGAGGLGSPAAMYLAAAGVGTIGIADADRVDLSNLQRQIMHSYNDFNKPKVQSAGETLSLINSDVKINEHYTFIDACVKLRKPFSHAGVIRFNGQLMTYVPECGPCYRCIFKEPPPDNEVLNCSQAGVIGAMCGVIGSLQAMEAVKYITGVGELLTGSLLVCDAMTMEFRKVKLPECTGDCIACKNYNN